MAERKRNYTEEYKYHSSQLQKRRRAARNAARRLMIKKGKVRKGDGKEVNHISRNIKGDLSNSPSNLEVLEARINRARNSRSYK